MNGKVGKMLVIYRVILDVLVQVSEIGDLDREDSFIVKQGDHTSGSSGLVRNELARGVLPRSRKRARSLLPQTLHRLTRLAPVARLFLDIFFARVSSRVCGTTPIVRTPSPRVVRPSVDRGRDDGPVVPRQPLFIWLGMIIQFGYPVQHESRFLADYLVPVPAITRDSYQPERVRAAEDKFVQLASSLRTLPVIVDAASDGPGDTDEIIVLTACIAMPRPYHIGLALGQAELYYVVSLQETLPVFPDEFREEPSLIGVLLELAHPHAVDQRDADPRLPT